MTAPLLFALKPTLSGERVTLRPFTGIDIEAMGPILADPEVLRLTGSVHTSEAAHAVRPMLDDHTRRWYETRRQQPDRLDLAVIDPAHGRCVGEVVINDVRPADATASIRILLGPTGRDRGLGTDAVRLMIDHVFRTTDLFRIELETFETNARAARVYEKVGFTVEGRRRCAFVFDGERIDAITMSLLRPEWDPVGVHLPGPTPPRSARADRG